MKQEIKRIKYAASVAVKYLTDQRWQTFPYLTTEMLVIVNSGTSFFHGR